MNAIRIVPVLLTCLLIACGAPPTPRTPLPTPIPVATLAMFVVETPTPTRPLIYLPALRVAPTPNPQVAYRQAMLSWLQEVMRWTDDLQLVLSTVAPSAPEWQPTLATFETRLLALEAQLHALAPHTGYVTAHEMMVVSMDACTDAITHFKAGDFGFGELSFSVCASGIILVTSRLP